MIWKNFGLLAESTTASCFNFVISLNAEDKFSNNKNTWFAKQLLSVLLIWHNWRRINPSPGFQIPPHHSGSRIIPFFVVCVYVKVIDFHVHTVCFLIYNVQWRWYGDKWWSFKEVQIWTNLEIKHKVFVRIWAMVNFYQVGFVLVMSINFFQIWSKLQFQARRESWLEVINMSVSKHTLQES